MNKETLNSLDELISEGEQRGRSITLVEQASNQNGMYGFTPRRYTINDPQGYTEWSQKVLRFVRVYSPADLKLLASCKKVSPRAHEIQLAILKSIRDFPNMEPSVQGENQKDQTPSIIINNSNTNTNTQSVKLVVSIINEAIKNELKGSQLKEIKAIIEEYKDSPQEAKTKVFDKIKSFGSDVASNILANIITNPNVWSGF